MNNMRLRFPGGRAKAFTMSYDDGVQQDLRLMEIMRAYGVKGTFNLNSGCFAPEGVQYAPGQIHRRMSERECVSAYAGADIEVAAHGETHPFLEALPTHACMAQVVNDRRNLERVFGRVVRGMAYPYGTYSDTVAEVLRLAGIAYARTTESTRDFRLPRDFLRMGATCHHNDPALMSLAEQFAGAKPLGDALMFYLWGHSYEFEGRDNWGVIEGFLKYIGGRDDIWYATNIEIVDYICAYRGLRASVDGSIIFNPYAQDVWAEIDGAVYVIPAGQALAR